MAVSEFPEWLYAITYMDIFSNYPKNCPQEMGIIFGNGILEKSGKNDFLITFQPVLLAKSDKNA
ncbi:TPA: hypothetical protein L3H12_003732 [Acinetobacter baumannii]|uniref:hypothetical protein n=1 Tax=Acinetobacter baumannii TaxID=470 RepID=UPI0006ACE7F1|nr:hypothetical protein [Acinetobacter baumannii]HBN5966945.1 hypothetical protein [Acinetobacter baumannii]